MRKLITLTTDFGTRDSYVAQMKGVLYAQGPGDLEVVDLTHEIAPQQVLEAALFVRAAVPRFPVGTIHVVVVDPGVGSARRALLCEHAGQFLLGPDNGVLSLALTDTFRALALRPERFLATELSATFHGRDLFAPAAARVARGALPAQLGDIVAEITRVAWPRVEVRRSELRGQVLQVDRFGNLISNISRADLAAWMPEREWGQLRVVVGSSAPLPIVRCYADAAPGNAIALFGSGGLLELAATNGSAAATLAASVGAELSVVSSPA
ncbi:MAG TPA: SAM-dependent chlorinase/fluorinase [Polyangiales bacterium]|nr:SAM-dependent chlorinase/fluorinase [Polyangiales bacterium]